MNSITAYFLAVPHTLKNQRVSGSVKQDNPFQKMRCRLKQNFNHRGKGSKNLEKTTSTNFHREERQKCCRTFYLRQVISQY